MAGAQTTQTSHYVSKNGKSTCPIGLLLGGVGDGEYSPTLSLVLSLHASICDCWYGVISLDIPHLPIFICLGSVAGRVPSPFGECDVSRMMHGRGPPVYARWARGPAGGATWPPKFGVLTSRKACRVPVCLHQGGGSMIADLSHPTPSHFHFCQRVDA